MQQLTLFSNHTATRRRRTARRATPANPSQPGWDLFARESDSSREMVLFFLDIRNFTPLAERLNAPDILHIVKKLFSTFQNIIRVHRGKIIETSGDGFYAAFGLNDDIAAATNAAVKAGLAILNTLDGMNESLFEKSLNQRINVGIGIHSGSVATGNLTIGSKEHFVVMGYAVNIAARIQTATKEFNNNFIVSSEVFDRLEVAVPRAEKISAKLKGTSDPMSLYCIGRSYRNAA
jgi:adenylate cyclase